MKKSKIIFIAVMIVLVLGLLVLPAFGQSPITAEIDRNNISTDEAIILMVSIDTSAGPSSQPGLPPMPDFQIVGTSSGTQMQMINGTTTVKSTYNYTLRPLQAGTLTIDPITVLVNGQSYTSQPISVNVSQGTGNRQPAPNPSMSSLQGLGSLSSLLNGAGLLAPGSSAPPLDPADAPTELVGQDFFIEGEVSNPNPYQGEQVMYTFRFYQAANLYDQPTFEPPAFSGFWSEQLEGQKEYTTEAAGRRYRVTELQTLLFPTSVGEATIDPAQLTIPGGFFDRGQVLRTQPVALTIRPLPAGAPADFQGAVGQFVIQAAVDKSEVEVNDTVNLNVGIGGFGNIEALPDPVWNEGSAWRAFDSKAKTETEIVEAKLGGTRTYERVLLPTIPGEQTLPGLTYSFFNPETETYETVTTDPIVVNVTGTVGANQAPVVAATSDSSFAMPAGAEQLRPNKPAAAVSTTSSTLLTQNGVYWMLWLLPLILIGGVFSWGQYRQHHDANADLRRSNKAAHKAKSALRQARKEPATANVAAGRILSGYITDKLNRSIDGLTTKNLAELLGTHGIEAALTDRVTTCLALSEMGRYAPSGTNLADNNLLSETEQLIDALDAAFKKI